jgi:hypothetical protein
LTGEIHSEPNVVPVPINAFVFREHLSRTRHQVRASYAELYLGNGNDSNFRRPSYATKPHGFLLGPDLGGVRKLLRKALLRPETSGNSLCIAARWA